MHTLKAVLVACMTALGAGAPSNAQDLTRDTVFDAGQWGEKNIIVRQSTGVDLESILSESGNHERLLAYSERNKLRIWSKPVGRLNVQFRNGSFVTCTATLVERDVILTNHHCVPNIPKNTQQHGPVVRAQLFLGYYSISRASKEYDVDITPIRASEAQDYAFLRVEGAPGDEWGIASQQIIPPQAGDSLLVIHHPLGQPKHVTRGGCRAAAPDAVGERGVQLFHLCDTLPGSSGAPIFNDDGQMIGIHRGGAALTDANPVNFGVLLKAIYSESDKPPAPGPTTGPIQRESSAVDDETAGLRAAMSSLETRQGRKADQRSCRHLHEEGYRYYYCLLRDLVDIEHAAKWSGMKVFLSGPHRSRGLQLDKKYDFGRYNPEFVDWLRDAIFAATENTAFVEATRPYYKGHLRQLAATLFVTHELLVRQPELLESMKADLLNFVEDRSAARQPVYYGFMNLENKPMYRQGFEDAEVNTAVGFWVRRDIDGTRQAFFNILGDIVEVYDEEFLDATANRHASEILAKR